MTPKTEIPPGNEQEQAKGSKSEVSVSKEKKSTDKRILILAALGLAILVAVLVAVVPDWKKSSSNEETKPNISDPNSDEPDAEGRIFQSSTGPFDAELPLFSSSITEGYTSREELAADLQELAKTFLNQAIASNLGGGQRGNDVIDSPVNAPMAPGGELEETDADFADDGGGGSETTADVGSATDFSTNNQEENVDRADFVKADRNYVYGAYGDYLLVWAVSDGAVVAKIQMPALANPKYPDDIFEPMPLEPLPEEGEPLPVEDRDTGEDTGDVETSSEPAFDYFWNPRPNIESILLEGDFLTLAVTGYGTEKVQALEETPVLTHYQATQIRVYEHDGNGNFELKSSTNINGYFRNAYSVGNNAHVVTHSEINTWHYLMQPIQRSMPDYKGMDDEQYQEKAIEIAEGLIEPFVNQLVQELDVNGEVDLARLAVFADSLSAENLEEELFAGDIASAISQVTSFDMTAGQDELSLSMAATFQPGHWGHVYATEGMIIVADQGWTWIEEEGLSGQKTYLIGFRLDGASSSHALVGSVDGYMLNSFSLDFVERDEKSYVRIATTQSFWTPWIRPFEVDAVDESDVDPAEDPIDTVVEPPESSTLNKIIVLEIPTEQNEDGDKVLREVGSVELGEPNERFTTVRFFDNFAYAVTFEQTDPFYVVDLSEEKPEKAGELKIPGFSEYLHPIDSNDQFLVAVGQNADDEGRVLGFQLSLFDATDPGNPRLVNRLDIEKEENAWSGSSSAWEERAFRFLKLGEKTGKIIIPLTINTWAEWDPVAEKFIEPPPDSNFQGFVVFDVANEVITKEFEIDHGPVQYFGEAQCGSYYNWLPERSFVFSGDVMTMQGYTVKSTSLTTGETEWSMDINDLSLGCEE